MLAVNPQKKARNLLSVKEIKMATNSQNKMYTVISDTDHREGGAIARNFVQGLEVLGLGKVDKDSKCFKIPRLTQWAQNGNF